MTLVRLRSETRGSMLLAWLDGELDMSNTGGLTTELAAAVPNTAEGLVLDLSGVTYMDSAGLGMLFALGRQLRARQQKMRLVVPAGARIQRLLDVASIATVAQIHPTLVEALA